MSKPNIKRRKFMLAIGAGSAGVVAAAVSRNKPETKEKIAATPNDNATGYHVTEHIRNYYRTTRV
jgi:hypothetical protein